MKTPKPIEFPADGEVRAAKSGSKLAALIDLLAREEGATLEQVAAELSRTGSKVDLSGAKSWIGYDLRRCGLGVKEVEGRLYLVGTPLPHREATPKKAPEPVQKVEAVPTKRAAGSSKAKSKKAKRATAK